MTQTSTSSAPTGSWPRFPITRFSPPLWRRIGSVFCWGVLWFIVVGLIVVFVAAWLDLSRQQIDRSWAVPWAALTVAALVRACRWPVFEVSCDQVTVRRGTRAQQLARSEVGFGPTVQYVVVAGFRFATRAVRVYPASAPLFGRPRAVVRCHLGRTSFIALCHELNPREQAITPRARRQGRNG